MFGLLGRIDAAETLMPTRTMMQGGRMMMAEKDEASAADVHLSGCPHTTALCYWAPEQELRASSVNFAFSSRFFQSSIACLAGFGFTLAPGEGPGT